jgi:predicted PurR-regulated permease PerM
VVCLLGASLINRSVAGFMSSLPDYQARLAEQTASLRAWMDEHEIEVFDPIVSDVLNPQSAMRFAGTTMSALSNLVANSFFILLIAIFILLEGALLPAKIKALPNLSAEMWRRLQGMVEDVRRYMAIKSLMSALTGSLVAAWLAVLGVDFPILMGVLAFILNFVPAIGSIIAGVPGVLLALVLFGPGKAAIVAAGYIVINVGVSNILEPRFMGHRLGLSPLVILISMVFWGWVLGPVGMLLSVPLTMTAKIALESGRDTRWLALLMAAQPPESATPSRDTTKPDGSRV